VQAAIQAVHSDALRASGTDWRQIVTLYDQLLAVQPTPVVALNRAVAVAEVDGPDAGLAVVDALAHGDGAIAGLGGYYLFHAIRADLLRRVGRADDAASEYEAALALTDNEAERGFLTRARASLP
jgi:RNA polymerase sigma-70 factor (ECF subfamily)